MRSLERRFREASKRNVDLSSFMCFVEAVHGQKFGKKAIQIWFRKLIDPVDYCEQDRRRLLKHMCKISNGIEEGMILG